MTWPISARVLLDGPMSRILGDSPQGPTGLRQRVLPTGLGPGRAEATVGAVSEQPCMSAVPPAGTLLLRAPSLPVLTHDTVLRRFLPRSRACLQWDVCGVTPLASKGAGKCDRASPLSGWCPLSSLKESPEEMSVSRVSQLRIQALT